MPLLASTVASHKKNIKKERKKLQYGKKITSANTVSTICFTKTNNQRNKLNFGDERGYVSINLCMYKSMYVFNYIHVIK